ncbi:DUF6326 family protein [Flagellimonas aequoris]|uniref:Uncharacterized protein n=1 Tax=Flagellimonas aequoris TaxID=2306997 RepID=A0A418N4B4_9FLAO|nr:DUF6326 family protein [Allomuricauda aequoris]RIV68741.1 hypothetical protein D2U88_16275 [Allomuricauda aequoris]TXK00439.1 hypothetical protein FQ019_16085 [Allomuricauda aequoris]
MKQPNQYQDFKVNVKIKLALLWSAVMFCYIYGDYFQLYVPGKVEGLIGGNNMLDNPFKLLMASLLLAIPALMVCLSVFLKPAANRFLNLLLGTFYTALMLLIALTSYSDWHMFYVFLAILESILTAIIVINAYKWPKNKE